MVRVRFAPSPTGYLHVGGVRTAIFNCLFARRHNGVFLLRIEDTDVERSTQEAVDQIIDSLGWLDLDWDSEPVFQSKRMQIYKEHLTRLLAEGHAYRCYCTAEELEAKRQQAIANKITEHLDLQEWKVIIVDEDENHYYQPGFLFIPFGIYAPKDVVKPKRDFIPRNVEFILGSVERIDPQANRVHMAGRKRAIQYDYLVIATGSRIVPDETPGLLDNGWHKNVFDFYTLDGATALSRFLKF